MIVNLKMLSSEAFDRGQCKNGMSLVCLINITTRSGLSLRLKQAIGKNLHNFHNINDRLAPTQFALIHCCACVAALVMQLNRSLN